MIRFAVYDVASGSIVRWGMCPEEMMQMQAKVGEGVVKDDQEGRDYSLFRIQAGVFVSAT